MMGALQKPRRFSRDEYFVWLERSAVKADWYDGMVLIQGQEIDIDTLADVDAIAMAGGTRAHARIGLNTASALDKRLTDRPCVAYNGDLAIEVDATGLYVFPDASVVCGSAVAGETRVPSIRNPALIVEVLSKGTAVYDRGAKLQHYRLLPSVREVVLIASDEVHVEVHRRLPDGDWLLKQWYSLDNAAELASLDLALPLAEVYARVEFDG
jgi:Uma2 family endonuclease